MNDKKVSIIVPVYNVEKYISKCVNSLLNQSYSNIEIILVDDGSTDKSGYIIDSFGNSNDSVIVIHKKNGGVSSARNTGIEAASGDYIMFVDGDDWIETDCVSYFISLIKKHHVNVVMDINYYSYNNNETLNKDYTVKSDKAIEWIYNEKLNVAVWNKMYSTDLVKRIMFSEDFWYGEGMLFNIKILQLIERIAIGERSVYNQTFNPQSAMRSFSIMSNYCGISSMWIQRAILKNNNPMIDRAWEYHLYRFNRTIIDGLIRSGQVKKNNAEFKRCVYNLRCGILLPIINEKNIRKKIGWILYFFAPKLMAKRSAKKFIKVSMREK